MSSGYNRLAPDPSFSPADGNHRNIDVYLVSLVPISHSSPFHSSDQFVFVGLTSLSYNRWSLLSVTPDDRHPRRVSSQALWVWLWLQPTHYPRTSVRCRSRTEYTGMFTRYRGRCLTGLSRARSGTRVENQERAAKV